ncbi:MAG: glycosyltransferase family 2 protein [Elusimicrobia bacterium]|nr:glycosyltransferase family 2 protein [Elusimicrobiota bacterium]
MNDLSVVVPVFNNALNLPDLFPALESAAGPAAEFVFVDDRSTDGSWNLLKEYAGRRPNTRVLRLSRNFGSFTACVAGLSKATGRAAVLISADLQDPPELIPEMVDLWRKGTKVVLAARRGRDDGWLSGAFSRLYYLVLRAFVFPDMPRGGFDFVLVDRQVVDALVAAAEKNTTLMGLILWLGFDRKVIQYDRRRRAKGRSMWTFRKKFKYSIDSVLAFSYFPIRIVQILGLGVAVGGFSYAALLIAMKLTRGIDIPGWTALMVVTLVLGGGQFLVLGVLGEYAWRALDEVKRRPLFVIDEDRA